MNVSEHLRLQLSDNCSISQILETISCPSSKYRKILTKNDSISHTQKKKQILEAVFIKINKLSLNKISFECSNCVLIVLNTFSAKSSYHLL